jgi:hypothetical protein
MSETPRDEERTGGTTQPTDANPERDEDERALEAQEDADEDEDTEIEDEEDLEDDEDTQQ